MSDHTHTFRSTRTASGDKQPRCTNCGRFRQQIIDDHTDAALAILDGERASEQPVREAVEHLAQAVALKGEQ